MAEFIFPTDDHPYYADEVGLALAGFIRRESDGSPRVGMLAPGPSVEAVAASWKVQVGPFTHVHDVSGSIRLTGQSAATQVDITPATTIPAGQARIDLVVWDLDEQELFVIDGTPGTSPTPPAYGGMVPVAEVRVNSGDGMVIAGQVTAVYESTGLASGSDEVSGKVAMRSVPAGGVVDVTVTFPAGGFDVEPNVQVTLIAATRAARLTVTRVSAASFTVALVNDGTGAVSMGAYWRAAAE